MKNNISKIIRLVITFNLIVIFLAYSGCQKRKLNLTNFAIRDALNQAISFEKLPDFNYKYIKNDTLYILPLTQNNKSDVNNNFSFSKKNAEKLPSHIDIWKVRAIDYTYLKNKIQSNKTFNYFELITDSINGDYRVDIIFVEMSQQEKESVSIDRRRFTIIFVDEAGVLKIKKMWSWYG